MAQKSNPEMRDFRFDKLPSFGAGRVEKLARTSPSSRQRAGNDEASRVLREIGLYLAAFLGIALAANALLAVLGISR